MGFNRKVKLFSLLVSNTPKAIPGTEDFDSPVFITQTMSNRGDDPDIGAAYLSGGTAYIRLKEPAGGTHTHEQVSILIAEEGYGTLRDEFENKKYEADIISGVTNVVNNGDSWLSYSFSNSFGSAPVVFARVFSDMYCHIRIKSLTSSGFDYILENYEGDTTTRSVTVHIFAIESMTGDYVEAGVTANTVMGPDDGFTTISHSLQRTPEAVIAQVLTYDGLDPCHVAVENLGYNSVDVACEEDEENDAEQNHTTEVVGYLFAKDVINHDFTEAGTRDYGIKISEPGVNEYESKVFENYLWSKYPVAKVYKEDYYDDTPPGGSTQDVDTYTQNCIWFSWVSEDGTDYYLATNNTGFAEAYSVYNASDVTMFWYGVTHIAWYTVTLIDVFNT